MLRRNHNQKRKENSTTKHATAAAAKLDRKTVESFPDWQPAWHEPGKIASASVRALSADNPDPLGSSDEDWEHQGWFLQLENRLLAGAQRERPRCPWHQTGRSESRRRRTRDVPVVPNGPAHRFETGRES
jgi:hypothetical protein